VVTEAGKQLHQSGQLGLARKSAQGAVVAVDHARRRVNFSQEETDSHRWATKPLADKPLAGLPLERQEPMEAA